MNRRSIRVGESLLTLLFAAALSLAGRGQDASSREVSLFNFGQLGLPSAGVEANSREVSVFNFGQLGVPSASVEALSHEVSVYNFGPLGSPSASVEAISREVSVYNFGQLGLASAGVEASSREVSVFNFGPLGLSSAGVEANSREVSVFNFGQLGLPSARLEATSREVSVVNYGAPQVYFTVGSTNSVGDSTGQVPLSYQTYLDLTNLSLTLRADDSHLRVLGVTPVAAEVQAVSLGAPGPNNYSISFALDAAAVPLTNHTLAYLNYRGVTNLDSAVVPLTVSNLASFRASGQFAPGVATNGQVILIVTKAILVPFPTAPLGFTMYGLPGATYSIQATTNLAPPVWLEVQRLTQTGTPLTFTGLTNRGPQQFYRAEQLGP